MPRKPLHHALIALVVGCGTPDLDEGGGVLALVDADGWEAQDPADDPLPEHRPAEVDCAPGGWGEEFGRLEIQTGICNYVSLVQPILAPVSEGDDLGVLVWHQGLDAAEPAEAHVALFLDGRRIWEATAAIPSDATVWEEDIPSPRDFEAGSELVFHLHNHGFNSWAVASPERIR